MNLLRALFFLVVSFEILVSMLSNLFLLDLDSLFKFELILSKNDLLDIVVKIKSISDRIISFRFCSRIIWELQALIPCLLKLPQIYPFLFFLKWILWPQSAHIRILLNKWVLWAGIFLLREDISCWTALNSSLEIIASWVFSIIIKSSLEAVFLLVEVTLLVVVLPWTKSQYNYDFRE